MQGLFQYQTLCRKCQGEGTVIKNPCRKCQGVGVTEQPSTVEIAIPAGVDDNMELRLANKGHAGVRGGPAGHMYVRIRVSPSRKFRRDGADIHSDVNIS